MNVFIRGMVSVFSFGERWNVPSVASLNGTFHLSPHENVLTIARMKTFIICIIITSTATNQRGEFSIINYVTILRFIILHALLFSVSYLTPLLLLFGGVKFFVLC
jgi:hypothetical protein